MAFAMLRLLLVPSVFRYSSSEQPNLHETVYFPRDFRLEKTSDTRATSQYQRTHLRNQNRRSQADRAECGTVAFGTAIAY
jgi:hypothetical protein